MMMDVEIERELKQQGVRVEALGDSVQRIGLSMASLSAKFDEHDKWERKSDAAVAELLEDHEARLRAGESFRNKVLGMMAVLGTATVGTAWAKIKAALGV